MRGCLPDHELPGSPSRTIRQRSGEDSGCNSNKRPRAHHDDVLELAALPMRAGSRRREILGIAAAAAYVRRLRN
jgi:hypothetical protein